MIFGKLKIKNFMSFRKAEIDLTKEGLFLVDGMVVGSKSFSSNGAGKSNIFEALVWVLFGKTIKGVTVDEVVNNKANRNCIVSVEVIDGSNLYTISRGRKDKYIGNSSTILVNGKDLTECSTDNTQNFIGDKLGLDYHFFVNSVIFGQGNVERFSSATDADRKAIIEEILGLDYIIKGQKYVKIMVEELNARLRRFSDRCDEIDRQLKFNLKNLFELDKKEIEFSGIKRLRILSLIRDIIVTDGEILKLDDMVIPHLDEREVESLNIQVLNKKKKIDKLNAKLSIKVATRIELESLTSKLSSLEKEISLLVHDRDSILSSGSTRCNACGQIISKVVAEKQESKISAKIVKNEFEKETTEKLIAKSKNQLSQVCNIETDVELLNRQYMKLYGELNEATSQRRLRVERISSICRMEVIRSRQLLELSELCREKYSGVEIQNNIRFKLKILSLEKRGLCELIDELEYEIYHYEFWVSGFSNRGIKSIIMDSVLPYLNDRANLYSDILTGGELSLEFINERRLRSGETRDKLEVSCSRVGGGSTYKGISGGEKRRIDLCQALALRDLVASRGSSSVDFLFMDECFESLDQVGVDRTMVLIDEISKSCKHVYVATHISELRGAFPQSITVLNREGESTIQ